MAESVQDNQPTSQPDPMTDFGANEWLVDEMYERYREDPNSVDPAWWQFFKARGGQGAPDGQRAEQRSDQPSKQPAGQPSKQQSQQQSK